VGKVLIVTENEGTKEYLSSVFQEIVMSKSVFDTVSAIKNNNAELVIIDYELSSIGAIELVKMIGEIYPKLLTVMLIPSDDNTAELDCLNNNIQRILNSSMSKELLHAYLAEWQRVGKTDFIEGTLMSVQEKLREFQLTKIELLLVVTLVKREGQIVDKNTIAEEVWHVSEVGQKLNTHIKKIRNKLNGSKFEGCLRTVHGRGFIWVSNE